MATFQVTLTLEIDEDGPPIDGPDFDKPHTKRDVAHAMRMANLDLWRTYVIKRVKVTRS